jgi:molecular chaperone DnaJ
MSKKDYYDILGVNKSSNESDIKKAYRKLAKEKHPDVGGDENEFKEIAEAYEVLSNPDKKSDYDAYGHKGKPASQGFGGANMDDLFRDFGFGGNFSQNRGRPRFGQDLRINIPLTLEEILNGTNKIIRYNRNGACTSCNSSGGHDITTCPTCQGQGSVVQHIRTPMGIMQNIEMCPSCHGQGTTYAVQCNVCQGNGVQRGEQEVSIDIPAGILDGNMLQYHGMGNAIKNGSAGKLIVNITEVAHKSYVRNGNDLKYSLKLKYPQLVLGDKVDIPTIDGTTIKISVPEHSKSGDNLRINNKGMKQMNTNNRGDMYIVLDVDFPKRISEEERELLNKLKNIEETVAKN